MEGGRARVGHDVGFMRIFGLWALMSVLIDFPLETPGQNADFSRVISISPIPPEHTYLGSRENKQQVSALSFLLWNDLVLGFRSA